MSLPVHQRARALRSFVFLGVAALTLGTVISHSISLHFRGDFWQHSAVIHQLTLDLIHPAHPQLRVDVSHPFYTPYAVALAAAARLFGMDAIGILVAAGISNTALLLFSLHRFSNHFLKTRFSALYLLGLTLVFWWPTTWTFSGFLHLRNFADTAHYPSTFAFAISLLGLVTCDHLARDLRWDRTLILMLVTPIVLISHPITAIFLLVGYASIWICCPAENRIRLFVLGSSVLVVSILAATLWPYFPFWDVVRHGSQGFHDANARMYGEVLLNLSPLLIGIPMIWRGFRGWTRNPLCVMLILLTGVYLFGYLSGKFTYGRSISFVVFLAHCLIAKWLSAVDGVMLRGHRLPTGARWLQGLTWIVIIALTVPFTWSAMYRYHPFAGANYSELKAVAADVEDAGLVLAPLDACLILPTFGPRVLAFPQAVPLVDDHLQRREHLTEFYQQATRHERRIEIIGQYDVDYVLVTPPARASLGSAFDELLKLGQVTYNQLGYTLLKMPPAPRIAAR